MPSDSNYYTYPMPPGPLTIQASSRGIVRIAIGEVALEGALASSKITNRCATELQEYFAGKRTAFDIPLDIAGSAFQKAVWQEVAAIEYGTTKTCAQVAEAIGKPGSHRSVGTAVNHNPCPIVIPDHRVALADGKTPGAGKEAALKRGLVALEKKFALER